MQAQTLQAVCPVSVGEFFSEVAGEFDDVPGSTEPEELEEVEAVLEVVEVVLAVVLDELVLRTLSPGDCPGGMNGDCGVLVR